MHAPQAQYAVGPEDFLCRKAAGTARQIDGAREEAHCLEDLSGVLEELLDDIGDGARLQARDA